MENKNVSIFKQNVQLKVVVLSLYSALSWENIKKLIFWSAAGFLKINKGTFEAFTAEIAVELVFGCVPCGDRRCRGPNFWLSTRPDRSRIGRWNNSNDTLHTVGTYPKNQNQNINNLGKSNVFKSSFLRPSYYYCSATHKLLPFHFLQVRQIESSISKIGKTRLIFRRKKTGKKEIRLAQVCKW